MIFASIYNKQDETALQYNLPSFKQLKKTLVIKIQKKKRV